MTNPPQTAASAGLQVRDLTLALHSHPELHLVKGASFDIPVGERVAVVGESGSGKTLTALSIIGLLPHAVRVVSGSVTLDGVDLLGLSEAQACNMRGSQISMVYQNPMTSLNPLMTVGAQVAECLRLHTSLDRQEIRERVWDSLESVGIADPRRAAKRYPHEFSGGMRQRVVIAMAMCTNPRVLIADEPTTALDVTTQARVLDLITQLSEEHGTAVLFITHDLSVAAQTCRRMVVMRRGDIVEAGETEALLVNPSHRYTAGLIAAAFDLSVERKAPLATVDDSLD